MAEASAAVTAPVTTAPVVDPSVTNPQPTPGTSAAKLFKIKVDGQEMELPESELISLAQQGKSASKRFQEAAQAKREAEQLVAYLKANPKEALKKIGLDVRKFSEDTLLEMLTHEQMSPEQKKAFENENELKKYRDQEKTAKEKAEQEQLQKAELYHMQNYDQAFTKALSDSGVPKTPYAVKRMAELTLVSLRKGLDLTPEQIAKVVKEDYASEHRELLGAYEGDQLIELLGKDALKRLSKAQLSKYKASKTNNSIQQSKPKDQTPPNPVNAWKAYQKKTRSLT